MNANSNWFAINYCVNNWNGAILSTGKAEAFISTAKALWFISLRVSYEMYTIFVKLHPFDTWHHLQLSQTSFVANVNIICFHLFLCSLIILSTIRSSLKLHNFHFNAKHIVSCVYAKQWLLLPKKNIVSSWKFCHWLWVLFSFCFTCRFVVLLIRIAAAFLLFDLVFFLPRSGIIRKRQTNAQTS